MASTKITRTSAISSEKKLTISTWIKRSYIGEEALIGNTATGSNWAMFYFDGANKLQFASYINSSYVVRVQTNRVFNDVGAWYHLQATLDVSLSTPEAKIYVNGEEQTDLAQNVQPSQNANTGWFYDWNFEVGVMFGSSYYLNGCLADTYYIQGYVYPPSTFGETDATTGEWKPKTDPTINYGGNGGNSCHLKFENSANMDLDSGDNNLTFTTSGALTQTQDSPSNVFATFNALNNNSTLTNGNLTATTDGAQKFGSSSTLGVSSGKFYWEMKVNATYLYTGVDYNPAEALRNNDPIRSHGWCYNADGSVYNNGSGSSFGNTFTTGDIIGVALDATNSKLYFSKNGVWQNSGVPTSGSTGTGAVSITANETYFAVMGDGGSSVSSGASANFGNGFFGTTAVTTNSGNGYAATEGSSIFNYQPPTGYSALSTKGLNL